MKKKVLAAALAAFTLLAACGGDDSSSTGTQPSGTEAATTDAPPVTESMPASTDAPAEGTINVPDDYATIQEAVDAAKPGDLILVAPGTYNEAVNVTTDDLTIRGLDRNTVILDGNFELDNGIRVLGAKGVAIENMTAMNYAANGFFWTGVDGYRGSYLTAYRTGNYGIYVFDSVNGQLDNSYAAGSPDAGVYIGECYPCNAVVDNVISEHNGLGYSGTNSGGGLYIINSTFRFNRAGVVPNSGSYEGCYPERDTTIVGNLVYSNNQADTPAIDVAILAMGNGIIPAGGVKNTIEKNLVYDHDKGGISLVPFLEEDPNDDMPTQEEWDITCAEQKTQTPVDPGGPLLWNAMQNTVVDNVLSDNRTADLLVASADVPVSTLGNCWAGNQFSTSIPEGIETLAPCGQPAATTWPAESYNIVSWIDEATKRPPSVDWKTAPLPPLEPQPQMPDAATAPANPATNVPATVDIDAIQVPEKPAS